MGKGGQRAWVPGARGVGGVQQQESGHNTSLCGRVTKVGRVAPSFISMVT